jgi:ribosome-associated protein
MEFDLSSGNEYIQLNQLLKLLGITESGGIANQVISDGEVVVNGNTERQKRKKLFAGDIVEIGELKILIKASKN